MDVDKTTLVLTHEIGGEHPHEAGENNKGDVVFFYFQDHFPLEIFPLFLSVVYIYSRDIVLLRPLQADGVLLVADEKFDLSRDVARLHTVHDGLEIRAAPRGEDGDVPERF